MLKNISNGTVDLKWAGTVVSLNPKDCCDVTASFNALGMEIVALEDRFVSKFKGKIEKFTPKASIPDQPDKMPETVPEPEKRGILRGRPKKRG